MSDRPVSATASTNTSQDISSGSNLLLSQEQASLITKYLTDLLDSQLTYYTHTNQNTMQNGNTVTRAW